MKEYSFRPRYCDGFSCIADECQESCCRAGWEIPIDDDTFVLYSRLDGEIGKKFARSTVIGEDGDRIFKLDEKGNCAFLNDDGLCELYIATGGRLCEICDNYPRFYEEFDGFTESGVSISCIEAQRLILSAKREDYRVSYGKISDELLEFLLKARKMMLDYVFSLPYADALMAVIDFSYYLQDVIEYSRSFDDEYLQDYSYSPLPDDYELPDTKESLRELCKLYLGTDIMCDEWKAALGGDTEKKEIPEDEARAYLAYLVYRYFLRAINDDSVIGICGVIASAFILPAILEGDFKKLSRLYAKEIEHDYENFLAISKAFLDEKLSLNSLEAIAQGFIA